LQQSQYRYKAGLVTYLEVVTNETTNLQAQLSNMNIQIRRMSAGVLLVKALGGGWQSTTHEGARAQTSIAAASRLTARGSVTP
jgi:outer membrane protein TolC